jgi:hypothetical protein
LRTTNPTWPDLALNSGLRGGKPATNRLRYGTTWLLGLLRRSPNKIKVKYRIKNRCRLSYQKIQQNGTALYSPATVRVCYHGNILTEVFKLEIIIESVKLCKRAKEQYEYVCMQLNRTCYGCNVSERNNEFKNGVSNNHTLLGRKINEHMP